MENRCVCCGAIIPEGRQVCPKCEWFIKGCEEMRNGKQKTRKMDELDARIILALADNRMNESEVARVVFMHRNGVVHRIEKIHQITGLDPTDLWDLYKLVQMVKERAAEDGK